MIERAEKAIAELEAAILRDPEDRGLRLNLAAWRKMLAQARAALTDQ